MALIPEARLRRGPCPLLRSARKGGIDPSRENRTEDPDQEFEWMLSPAPLQPRDRRLGSIPPPPLPGFRSVAPFCAPQSPPVADLSRSPHRGDAGLRSRTRSPQDANPLVFREAQASSARLKPAREELQDDLGDLRTGGLEDLGTDKGSPVLPGPPAQWPDCPRMPRPVGEGAPAVVAFEGLPPCRSPSAQPLSGAPSGWWSAIAKV